MLPPNCCLVCGDPAFCCHYNVPSCPACKIFFRRTVVNKKTYGCSKNGTCKVTGKGYCCQCRFDRCIRVGMNPVGIKFPKNVDVRAVFDFVESRKRAIVLPSTSPSPDIPFKMASINLPQPMEYRDVDFLLFLELKVRKLRRFSFNPDYLFKLSIKDIVKKGSELGNADRYDCNVSNFPDSNYGHNSVYEVDIKNVQRILQHWVALDLLLTIEMAKILPVYSKLEQKDKEQFVRNTYAIVTVFTCSYYSYENRSEVTIYPDGTMPVLLFLNRSGSISKLENEITVRCIEPVKRIDLTKEEYVLLKAVLFCNPTCENLSDAGRELLKKEFERYSQTLLRYTQSIHGEEKGASRYAQVIAVVEAMLYFAMRTREYQLIRQLQRVEEAKQRGLEYQRVSIIDESF